MKTPRSIPFVCLVPLIVLLALFCCQSSACADEVSKKLVKYNRQTDKAVDRALLWLARNQFSDGSYQGNYGKTSAVPALAGMAYLSKGYTPRGGPYSKQINDCIDFVMGYSHAPEGYLAEPGGNMYSHCICTLFLSEVSGMVDAERQKIIDDMLPRALKLILVAQQAKKNVPEHRGGWRYAPMEAASDLSVSGWAIMALRSAKLNGAPVPDSAIADASQFVLRCRHPDGYFQYDHVQAGYPINMTGVAILSLSLCGQHDNEVLPVAGDWLLNNYKPIRVSHPYYGEYYCSQAMFQLGGKYWEQWADAMYPRILDLQKHNGSWDNAGYATAMSILAITVSYRQLPVYQR